MELRQRFYRHVVAVESDCHMWVGCKDRKGYGRFLYNGQAQMAHRVALLIAGRQLPSGSGFSVDHLCRNRACVNINHLEAVAHDVNVQRGMTGEANRSKTTCPQGHTYAGSNLAFSVIRGGYTVRRCRECAKLGTRKRRIQTGE